MPSYISNLQPTTELEAVNAMLGAIGEAAIASLDGATQADVQTAINILRDVTRETQSRGWRFNTEFGYQIAPSGTLVWTDTSGVSTTLNIFKPPVGLIRFDTTATSEQATLDIVRRYSRYYQENSAAVEVFYDRALNRDGLDQTIFPFLYIDPVWFVDFEKMPEVARRFCTLRAARRFIEQTVGSTTLAGFTEQDLSNAFVQLQSEEGEDDDYNMLNNNSVFRFTGNRPLAPLGMLYDPRKSPNHS